MRPLELVDVRGLRLLFVLDPSEALSLYAALHETVLPRGLRLC